MKNFDSYYTLRIGQVLKVLNHLIDLGLIEPNNLKGEILDFGGAEGSCAYALSRFGGNVTSIDTSSRARILENGILPEDRIIQGDGLEYLTACPLERFDFIAAFLMYNNFPFNLFFWKATSVLKDGGQLLLTCGLESSTEINSLHNLGIVTGFDHLGAMDYFSFTSTRRKFYKLGDFKRYLEATV